MIYDKMYIHIMRPAQKKGGITMEIGALASTALYQMEQGSVKVNGYERPTDVGVAMLDKQLEQSEASGQNLIRAMELSVNPSVGGNVDFYA